MQVKNVARKKGTGTKRLGGQIEEERKYHLRKDRRGREEAEIGRMNER